MMGHSGAKHKNSLDNPFVEEALQQGGFLPDLKVKKDEEEDAYLIATDVSERFYIDTL